MSIIRFALLKVPVATGLIQKEVEALQKNQWQPHINRYHYEGEWNVLSLRSPGGSNNALAEAINNQEYADTPLMKECPGIKQLVNELKCEINSVRLLSLHPGAVIKEHTDKELNFENGEARLHFPIFTNPSVEFFIDNVSVRMNEGECWYINANLPHRLANKGTQNRIHLVIDCKVNEWLQNLFQTDFVLKDELNDAAITLRKKDTIIQMINELRKQTNPAAQDLVINLEQQLRDAGYDFPLSSNGQEQPENGEVAGVILSFIRSIGIAVREESLTEKTFLPGVLIRNGELIFDKKKLLYPGDLLHEAGHIAVVEAHERHGLNENTIKESKHREAEEMMSIAWSYAACTHLNIDPLIVFHDHGYQGGGKNIAENFGQKKYFGVPMLQWIGLTADEKKAVELQVAPYPNMMKWLR